MKNGKLSTREMAEALDCHIDTIFRMKRREHRPSPEMAVKLEKLLGIDRRRFMWPEDFGDPWRLYDKRFVKKAKKKKQKIAA